MEIDGPETPTQGETLNRSPESLPPLPPQAIELAEMVSKADKIQHDLGLEKLGFSPQALQRIRDLDELASSSGQFMAISLEKTQRSYYVQLMELMQLAHKLLKRLSIEPGQEGYILDDEARAAFNKNYIEMVKEGGRGFELMLTGTQAMVKMMMDSKGKDGAPGATKKPAWRKVAAADRHLPDA